MDAGDGAEGYDGEEYELVTAVFPSMEVGAETEKTTSNYRWKWGPKRRKIDVGKMILCPQFFLSMVFFLTRDSLSVGF